MPTLPYFGATLLLSKLDDDNTNNPYTWPEWLETVCHETPPCHPDYQPDGVFSSTDLDSISAFATAFWGKPAKDRYAFCSGKLLDNYASGRRLWTQWVSSRWLVWGINAKVDGVLVAHNLNPHAIMAVRGIRKMPPKDQCNVGGAVIVDLARTLFGEDAFYNPTDVSPSVKPGVTAWLDAILVKTWDRYRKSSSREVNRLTKLQKEEKKVWDEITAPGAKPTGSKVQVWLRKCTGLLSLLKVYGDPESRKLLEDRRQTMEGIKAVLVKEQPAAQDKIPTILRDAIFHLSGTREIKALELDVSEAINMITAEPDYDVPELPDLNADVDLAWEEGVEDLSRMSTDQLWEALGFSNRALPFFNSTVDPTGNYSRWTPEGQAFFTDPSKTKGLLEPRWSQLVGLLKMVRLAFLGLPCLLADGVGLGKSLQVIALIAVLTFYREFHDKTGDYPGAFKGHQWQTAHGDGLTIPKLDSVIVVPVNLHSQMMSEIYQFLVPGSFDVFPYTGLFKTRAGFWSMIEKRCPAKTRLGRRLFVATITALKSDSQSLHSVNRGQPSLAPKELPQMAGQKDKMIYRSDYLASLFDEAQSCRVIGPAHDACTALCVKSSVTVAMTATPVISRLEDLWNIGRMLRLERFVRPTADVDMCKIQKACAAAKRRDRKNYIENEATKASVGALLRGEGGYLEEISEHEKVVSESMLMIREGFKGCVIRRTGMSLDANGQPIIGLRPVHEHILTLDLYDWEADVIEKLAEEMETETSSGSALAMGQEFYLKIRKTLTHPCCNDSYPTPWTTPASISDWEDRPTVKIETLVNLVNHHLANDFAVPLTIDSDGSLVPVDDYKPPVIKGLGPDKILIYLAFPSSNMIIEDVLGLYGFHEDIIEVNGYMPPNARSDTIALFNMGTGPRILLLSGVAQTGLNLPVANILIMVDTLWSAMEDQQLIGRIWRPPQEKDVHVYRLIADGTSDVFLNKISFDKSAMHMAFTGTSESMKRLFAKSGAAVDDDPARGTGDDKSSEERTVSAPNKRKTKGKAKADATPSAGSSSAKATSRQHKGKTSAKDRSSTHLQAKSVSEDEEYEASGDEEVRTSTRKRKNLSRVARSSATVAGAENEPPTKKIRNSAATKAAKKAAVVTKTAEVSRKRSRSLRKSKEYIEDSDIEEAALPPRQPPAPPSGPGHTIAVKGSKPLPKRTLKKRKIDNAALIQLDTSMASVVIDARPRSDDEMDESSDSRRTDVVDKVPSRFGNSSSLATRTKPASRRGQNNTSAHQSPSNSPISKAAIDTARGAQKAQEDSSSESTSSSETTPKPRANKKAASRAAALPNDTPSGVTSEESSDSESSEDAVPVRANAGKAAPAASAPSDEMTSSSESESSSDMAPASLAKDKSKRVSASSSGGCGGSSDSESLEDAAPMQTNVTVTVRRSETSVAVPAFTQPHQDRKGRPKGQKGQEGQISHNTRSANEDTTVAMVPRATSMKAGKSRSKPAIASGEPVPVIPPAAAEKKGRKVSSSHDSTYEGERYTETNVFDLEDDMQSTVPASPNSTLVDLGNDYEDEDEPDSHLDLDPRLRSIASEKRRAKTPPSTPGVELRRSPRKVKTAEPSTSTGIKGKSRLNVSTTVPTASGTPKVKNRVYSDMSSTSQKKRRGTGRGIPPGSRA